MLHESSVPAVRTESICKPLASSASRVTHSVRPRSYDLAMDIRETETVLRQKDMTEWCPSSGENVGRMIPATGDDWWIECPTCGLTWSGGSTVLSDHNRFRQ